VTGILSYCKLVVKFSLEDVSSVYRYLIRCSSSIQSEVVVVTCVCVSICYTGTDYVTANCHTVA
jgi:hypothetical protein